MPNQINANGLTTKSLAQVTADLTAAYQQIYGADANLASNTPDGQLIGIFAQMIIDQLDLNTQTYTSFDPDQAIGRTLDSRVAINGIKRQAGSYSTIDITVSINSSSVHLNGLEGNITPVGGEFTVQDNSGNQWVLINSYTITSPTYPLTFRSVKLGPVLAAAGTITTPVSVVLGVTAVTNLSAPITIGANEETDGALRLRRKRSTALASSGFYDSLVSALLNVTGVSSAQVYENKDSITDPDGTPGHSIWVIVSGTASNAAIAQAIYSKRSAGCGMRGAVSYTITRLNGTPFIINWDIVQTQNMYLKFQLDALSGNLVPTGTIPAAGGTVITAVSSTANVAVGMLIRGAGIPANTYVTATSLTTITISRVTTGGGSTGTLTIPPIVADPAVSGSLANLISAQLLPTVFQELNINQISTLIQSINSNALVSYVSGTTGLSIDNSTYANFIIPGTLTTPDKSKQFALPATNVFVL